MLYVTTRDSRDAYTANRALSENRGPEGGFYVPMRLPRFDADELKAVTNKTFGQTVAEVLNLFFGTQLGGWDVEFGIGRYPLRLNVFGSKLIVAEVWHNPVYRFERLVSGVEKVIRHSDQISAVGSDWLVIAARIAVLFGIYGQLRQNDMLHDNQKLDISVPAGNLSATMSAWYARAMGLPIGTIVCCCNENAGLWNLLHKGQLHTGAIASRTHTPGCDYAVPDDLERLIFSALGRQETARFCEICRVGELYELDAEQLKYLREGLHISVIGDKRMAATIPNLYITSGYVAEPATALAYSGLMDYRASTGENRTAVILSEESPRFSAEFMATCMNITLAELKQILD